MMNINTKILLVCNIFEKLGIILQKESVLSYTTQVVCSWSPGAELTMLLFGTLPDFANSGGFTPMTRVQGPRRTFLAVLQHR